MIQLIRRKSGKFDWVETAENGELLIETRQGFEKRQGAYKNLISRIMNGYWLPDKALTFVCFQDNTGIKPVIKLISIHSGTVKNWDLEPTPELPLPKLVPVYKGHFSLKKIKDEKKKVL